jgi:hypothetical protein
MFLINFQQVEEFGNNLFDKTFGLLDMLPSSYKAVATIILLFLALIGLLGVIRKGLKVFLIVVALLVVVAVVMNFIK